MARQRTAPASPPHKKPAPAAAPPPSIAKRRRAKPRSALQQRLQQRLHAADFRKLNEALYTATGAQSLRLMRADPRLFRAYHAGYAEQVRRWPRNPLDDVVAFLRAQPPRLRVADLGCGEARLAREAPQKRVMSFDLVAAHDAVVECDIAHVPLPDSTVDVAVFCLSLMGTNYGDYVAEARRILVPGGLMLVAEVASRFDRHDPKAFVAGVQHLGFCHDSEHPFAQAHAPPPASSAKRKRGGRKKAKKDRQTDEEPVPGSSAFFFRFAFRSTKKQAMDSSGRKTSALPKLGACVYKKR